MKPEDRKRLKRFWLGKRLLLTSFIGSVGIVVITVPFLQLQYAMVQEAEGLKALTAFPDMLLKDLKSTDPQISNVASHAIAQLGDKRAVPFLLKRLNDSDPYVRDKAAWALKRLGDKRVVPLLLKRLNDSDPYVQVRASEAIAKLGDKRAIPFLLKHLNDSDPYIRASAIKTLGQLKDERAVPFLLKRNDSDSNVRDSEAALILKQLGDKKAVPFLLKHLNDSDPYHRAYAAITLGKLGYKRVVPFLLEVLYDKKSPYRFEAFRTLKKFSESGQVAKFSQSTAYLFLILGGGLFLGTVFVGGMGLIFFLRMPNPYPLSWSGHLLLPEETIAELIALKRRRQKQNLPQWKLLLELTTEVLLLLWAIHIQVRFQNLSLPPSKKRNID
jgi:HEAT repeat protein